MKVLDDDTGQSKKCVRVHIYIYISLALALSLSFWRVTMRKQVTERNQKFIFMPCYGLCKGLWWGEGGGTKTIELEDKRNVATATMSERKRVAHILPQVHNWCLKYGNSRCRL